jgi:Protein of unknown function (DUF2889)
VSRKPFRRRVVLRRTASDVVDGEIEDHIHHFGVRLGHREARVTAIEGRAVRAPWSLCPGASAQLAVLVGAPVGVPPPGIDPTAHCTHLLDLAVVALRFAAGGPAARRFALDITGWDTPELTASARRDDGRSLRWTVRGRTITGPEPYAGQRLGSGFAAWASATLDDDDSELALLLRRATWMSASRGIDLDQFERLSQSAVPPGSCFASQPQRIELARRNRGSSLPDLPEM